MKEQGLHFEPYVHLAGLGYHRALISWGGFFFRRTHSPRPSGDAEEYVLMDDEELEASPIPRSESIGEKSEPYGRGRVRVFHADGSVAAEVETTDVNHAWLEGLRADTQYHYEIEVDGRNWLEGERYDWIHEGGRSSLRPSGRRYRCEFRTHPAPDVHAPLTFAVIGDFGIGVRSDHDDARRQSSIARGLERAVFERDVRVVLTTGDNIYLGARSTDGGGEEDDDWFFTFYQPYRYVLDCVPFYPTVGNHDSSETEASDDRSQLDDNFFLRQRFDEERDASRASVNPGLFYHFDYGAAVAFVCIDTTRDDSADARFFTEPRHHEFLQQSFPPVATADRRWRIPFSHHPVYCAGPEHQNTDDMLRSLVPLFERSGVRLVLAGHEHNFQYSRHNGLHYIVSGAAGQLRAEPPTRFSDARTVAWKAEAHFLVVSLDHERAVVHVMTANADGALAPMVAQTPEGAAFETPIVIARDC